MFEPNKLTGKHALVLDFDGTLVDIAETPSSVDVPADLTKILTGLYEALGGAVAIVSGRPVREIENFIQLPAAMQIAGVHGAEWRGEKGCDNHEVRAQLNHLADALETEFAGQLIERKSMAVAIHFRNRPDLETVIATYLKRALSQQNELTVIAGKSVFEVKPVWANKGTAVRRLLADVPFLGRTAIMFGDDVTDEDGFQATQECGGHAVKVGPGETIAGYRLASPAAVKDWLVAATQALNTPD